MSNYISTKNTTCPICNQKLTPYGSVECAGCKKSYCRKHRDLFNNNWLCPDCISLRQNYSTWENILKTADKNIIFNYLFK